MKESAEQKIAQLVKDRASAQKVAREELENLRDYITDRKWIVRHAHECGITVSEIARLTGMSDQTVSRWLHR